MSITRSIQREARSATIARFDCVIRSDLAMLVDGKADLPVIGSRDMHFH